MGREILTSRQLRFLDIFQRAPALLAKVYLTGGTALAAFYLNHRESEDLGFFSEEEIEPLAVETFLKSEKRSLGFDHFEFQRAFNRNLFFLHYPDGALKTEFTYFPFPPITPGLKEGGLRIDSLRDIAVNKVFIIHQQTRARDFIDLYFILRKEENWRLQDLVKEARIKFDTRLDLLQLGANLLKAEELIDLPRMRVSLDRETIRAFFVAQAKALKTDLLVE